MFHTAELNAKMNYLHDILLGPLQLNKNAQKSSRLLDYPTVLLLRFYALTVTFWEKMLFIFVFGDTIDKSHMF